MLICLSRGSLGPIDVALLAAHHKRLDLFRDDLFLWGTDLLHVGFFHLYIEALAKRTFFHFFNTTPYIQHFLLYNLQTNLDHIHIHIHC